MFVYFWTMQLHNPICFRLMTTRTWSQLKIFSMPSYSIILLLSLKKVGGGGGGGVAPPPPPPPPPQPHLSWAVVINKHVCLGHNRPCLPCTAYSDSRKCTSCIIVGVGTSIPWIMNNWNGTLCCKIGMYIRYGTVCCMLECAKVCGAIHAWMNSKYTTTFWFSNTKSNSKYLNSDGNICDDKIKSISEQNNNNIHERTRAQYY